METSSERAQALAALEPPPSVRRILAFLEELATPVPATFAPPPTIGLSGIATSETVNRILNRRELGTLRGIGPLLDVHSLRTGEILVFCRWLDRFESKRTEMEVLREPIPASLDSVSPPSSGALEPPPNRFLPSRKVQGNLGAKAEDQPLDKLEKGMRLVGSHASALVIGSLSAPSPAGTAPPTMVLPAESAGSVWAPTAPSPGTSSTVVRYVYGLPPAGFMRPTGRERGAGSPSTGGGNASPQAEVPLTAQPPPELPPGSKRVPKGRLTPSEPIPPQPYEPSGGEKRFRIGSFDIGSILPLTALERFANYLKTGRWEGDKSPGPSADPVGEPSPKARPKRPVGPPPGRFEGIVPAPMYAVSPPNASPADGARQIAGPSLQGEEKPPLRPELRWPQGLARTGILSAAQGAVVAQSRQGRRGRPMEGAADFSDVAAEDRREPSTVFLRSGLPASRTLAFELEGTRLEPPRSGLISAPLVEPTPEMGQITLVAPPLKVASPEVARSGAAVQLDWATLAAGSGDVTEEGLGHLARILPKGARVIYPAIPQGATGPGAVNLRLATPMVARLLESGYGSPIRTLAPRVTALGRSTASPPPAARPLPALLVPTRAPAGAPAGVLPDVPGTGAVEEAGAGQAKRGGVLDFLGVPVRLAPSLGGRPELRQEIEAQRFSEEGSGDAVRPQGFAPVRNLLFSSFQSVEPEPDVPAWRRAAPTFGLRSPKPAAVLASDALVTPPAPGEAQPQQGVRIPGSEAKRPEAAMLSVARRALTDSGQVPTSQFATSLGPFRSPLDIAREETPAPGMPSSSPPPGKGIASLPTLGRLATASSPSWGEAGSPIVEVPSAPVAFARRLRATATPDSIAEPRLYSSIGKPAEPPVEAPEGRVLPMGAVPVPSIAASPFLVGRSAPVPNFRTGPTAGRGTGGASGPDETSGPPLAIRTPASLSIVAPERLFVPPPPRQVAPPRMLQTSMGGGGTRVVTTPPRKPKSDPPPAPANQPASSRGADVTLLANEVWTILKRRLAFEADRRGRW